MKKIMLILLMATAASSYTQSTDSLKIAELQEEIRVTRNDGFMRLSIGIFAHAIGATAFVYGPITDPDVASQFIMYNTIALIVDAFAIAQFNKSRKKKKELKKLLNI
jgi:hypothetical protein